jgi:MerR family transcriptional regulator, light-induced transcriptional regulator
MRHLKTSEAATLLSVSPNTLRAWERRFGFPSPQRSPGMHRLYLHAELAALHNALQDGLSISSAISRARRGLADDGESLVGALLSFEPRRADAAIETAMSLRSVEASVEEVLLPALEMIANDYTVESAAWAFAARWGADWLRRATRFAPPPDRQLRIVVGDASRDELDRDFAYIRAFELFCGRVGIKILSLSARGATGIGDALSVHSPDLVVLAGGHLADEAVARWTFEVRRAAGAIPVVVYRRGQQRMEIPTTGTLVLPSGASDAQRRLLELVEAARAASTIPAARTERDSSRSLDRRRIVSN